MWFQALKEGRITRIDSYPSVIDKYIDISLRNLVFFFYTTTTKLNALPLLLLEEEFSESRPEGCGEVGVQDGIDTRVGVGQHVGSYLKKEKKGLGCARL